MKGFRLHAVGDLFDVDRYLSEYKIDFDSIWHRGKIYSHSGFVKYLGSELEFNLEEQESIAIEYMEKNKDALKALVKWPNVEAVILGISPKILVDTSTVGFCVSFSPSTIAIAAEIGLELAFYVEIAISLVDPVPPAEESWWFEDNDY